MPDNTLLCGKRGELSAVTIAKYKTWNVLPDKGWSKKPAFLEQRVRERYIDPIEKLKPEDKNGFAIMALSCLMIETLESFYQGWESTYRRSQECFELFFARQSRFNLIQDAGLAVSFYRNVRCGILHLGETKGGWKISRKGSMFNQGTMTLNATVFHHQVGLALKDYCVDLSSPLAADPLLRNRFDNKMNAIIYNCG